MSAPSSVNNVPDHPIFRGHWRDPIYSWGQMTAFGVDWHLRLIEGLNDSSWVGMSFQVTHPGSVWCNPVHSGSRSDLLGLILMKLRMRKMERGLWCWPEWSLMKNYHLYHKYIIFIRGRDRLYLTWRCGIRNGVVSRLFFILWKLGDKYIFFSCMIGLTYSDIYWISVMLAIKSEKNGHIPNFSMVRELKCDSLTFQCQLQILTPLTSWLVSPGSHVCCIIMSTEWLG